MWSVNKIKAISKSINFWFVNYLVLWKSLLFVLSDHNNLLPLIFYANRAVIINLGNSKYIYKFSIIYPSKVHLPWGLCGSTPVFPTLTGTIASPGRGGNSILETELTSQHSSLSVASCTGPIFFIIIFLERSLVKW